MLARGLDFNLAVSRSFVAFESIELSNLDDPKFWSFVSVSLRAGSSGFGGRYVLVSLSLLCALCSVSSIFLAAEVLCEVEGLITRGNECLELGLSSPPTFLSGVDSSARGDL